MKPFRDPFSLETAEGFPVDNLGLSSGRHVRPAPPAYALLPDEKKKENKRYPPKKKESGR